MTTHHIALDLYSLLDNDGAPLIKRAKSNSYPTIPREVQYDPHSLLQVSRSAYTHTPQLSLIPNDSLTLDIDPRHYFEPQFLFPSPYEDAELNSFGKKIQIQDTLGILNNPLVNFNQLLWSRFLSKQDFVVDLGITPGHYPFKVEKQLLNPSHRQLVLMYGLETILNFNPKFLPQLYSVLTKIDQEGYVNNTEVLNAILSAMKRIRMRDGVSTSRDLYREILSSYENSLETDNRTYSVIEIGSLMSKIIREPSVVDSLLRSRGYALCLWCLLPHPFEFERSEEMDFVLFTIACIIRTGRIPTHQEYLTRTGEATTTIEGNVAGQNQKTLGLNNAAGAFSAFSTAVTQNSKKVKKLLKDYGVDKETVNTIFGGIESLQSVGEAVVGLNDYYQKKQETDNRAALDDKVRRMRVAQELGLPTDDIERELSDFMASEADRIEQNQELEDEMTTATAYGQVFRLALG